MNIYEAREMYKSELKEDPTVKLYHIKIDGIGGVKADTYMIGNSMEEAWGAVAEGMVMLKYNDLSDDGSEEVT